MCSVLLNSDIIITTKKRRNNDYNINNNLYLHDPLFRRIEIYHVRIPAAQSTFLLAMPLTCLSGPFDRVASMYSTSIGSI